MAGLSSDDASLAEMIAYVINRHHSGCLLVRRRESGAVQDARLYFDGGHLVDARLGDEAGDDIVYRTLGAKDRLEFGWQSGIAAPGHSISRPDEYFLMATLGIDAAMLADGESAGARRAAAALQQTPAPTQSEAPAPPPQPSPSEQMAAQPDLVESAHLHFSRRDSLPMPQGRPISLNEALGNSPRHLLSLDQEADLGVLLDGLSKGEFSGYLCWERKGSRGTLMFYRGQIIDALWGEVAGKFGMGNSAPTANNASSGAAYRQIAADAEQENIRSFASLYALDDEFVYSYSALAYGENLLGSRSSRDVSLANLLASLERNRHSGCVRLTLEQRGEAADDVPDAVSAYIFFSSGRELGRYIEEEGALQADAAAPNALARNQHTLIDIYTAPPREAFAILTVPADAPDPGELLAQRDLRLSGRAPTAPTPVTPSPARRTIDEARATSSAELRAAPPTRLIDTAEALRPPTPANPPSPPIVSRVSDSGRLTTNSGRLSGGPQNPRDLAVSLQEVARAVLGSKAGRVVDILQDIERRPHELTRIITQAKRATKMLIGIDEYEELSDKFDALLGAYKLNQLPLT